jgi:hypothetical protein
VLAEQPVTAKKTACLLNYCLESVITESVGLGRRLLPKMLEAKDGRKQAHMDVLVAVFGRSLLPRLPPQ